MRMLATGIDIEIVTRAFAEAAAGHRAVLERRAASSQ
jgi:hypothetical protein